MVFLSGLTGVSSLLEYQLSLGCIWVWRAVAWGQLGVLLEAGRFLSQAGPQFLCPEASEQVPNSGIGAITCAH